MAKRINLLEEIGTIANDNVFAIDSATIEGKTNKITFANLKNAINGSLGNINNCTITTGSTFLTIHYTNALYIASGCYTQSYIATRQCIVFWHIEWDCSGNDGLYMQIIDAAGNVKAEITIMRNFEANNSAWMNKNGEIPLGPGMGIRFRGANPLLAQAGNLLTYLVAFLDK